MLDYDQLAAGYARHRAVNPEVLKSLISGANLDATSRVLEVGCGTGNYIGSIRQATRAECWGIEPSAKMLAAAIEHHPELTLESGSAESIPFSKDTFDLVCSVDVIHHVDDYTAYFREARRVLKQGGFLCTVTDSDDVIRRRRPLSNYFPETIAVELARYPSIDHLTDQMERVGFTDIRTEHVEFSYMLDDIQPYRDKAFSCLHLISTDAFRGGINRMRADQEQSAIDSLSLYTLLWGQDSSPVSCRSEGTP